MIAIYNENDRKAAQWTRNLIAGGHVANGIVDERSIQDLAARDVAGPGQRHFFAGIAGWSLALRLAGVPDDADIWTGSCPCQGFSSAGRKAGFADPRHLWPTWFGLIRECRPPIILGEQVASRGGWAWLDLVFADLEGAGYACAAADLPACSVGAPHRRQRLFFVAHADGQPGRLLASRREPGRADAQAERRGKTLDLANTASAGRQERRGSRGRERPGSLDSGASSRVANPAGERRGGLSRDDGARREQPELAGRGAPGGMGDSGGTRSGRNPGALSRAQASDSGQRDIDRRIADESVAAGAAHSGWHSAEWIPCSDGVSRPVEPGTHPLAHGVPGRVGLLRGYGNAINPEVAAAFIRAAIVA